MSSSWNRSINMFINIDGEKVENNVKKIRGELQHIINAQAKMTIGSAEYQKQTIKIQQLRGILKNHAEAIGQIQTPMQKAIGFAKGLLPAMGFAAIASGAKYAFDQVVASTDTLSTKWAIFTGGLKSGMNEFWRTIATGDWSNFIGNMNEAVRVGREYEKMLDATEEKTRALRIQEANSRDEQLKLEEAIRNKTLSKADRTKAGQDRIALEEELSKQRVKVAQDAFDADLMVTMQQTKLSKTRLMEVVADMDSETKAKAQAYNEQLELYKSTVIKSQQFQVAAARGGITTNPFTQQLADAKAQLDSYPESVKSYAEALKGVSSTSDEQLNKMVSSYEALMTAQNSAAENTKRVRTQVNSLLAGEDSAPGANAKTGETPANKDAENAKAATDAIELAYKEQQVFLKDRYEGEETLQKEYKARMLANELAYILAKQELTDDDATYLDLQSQFIDKQREYTAALRETAPELMLTQEGIAGLNNRLLEEVKLLDLAAKKQSEAAGATEELRTKTENQRDMIIKTTGILSEGLMDFASGSEDALKDAAKNMINFALDVLKIQVQMAIAHATIQSLTQPDSITTMGATGLIRAAILAGLIEVAFAGVKGLVNSAFYDGGYTGGNQKYKPAGIVHEGEWVASQDLVNDPVTGSIIAGLQRQQEARYTPTKSALKISRNTGSMISIVKTNTQKENFMHPSMVVPTDPELKKILAANTEVLYKLQKWNPKVSTQLIQNDLKTLENIDKNRGL